MVNQLKNSLIILVALFLVVNKTYSQEKKLQEDTPTEVREFFVSSLIKIGDPVLTALSKNKLKKVMPVEKSPGAWDDRTHVTYLEGFGRLLSGMAPWLELGPDKTDEGKLRAKYIALAQKCIHNATNPEAPDFMNFNNDKQSLINATFLHKH